MLNGYKNFIFLLNLIFVYVIIYIINMGQCRLLAIFGVVVYLWEGG